MESVFLTGASSGIGLAIAKLLVAQGHEVWATSRNLEHIPKMPRLHPVCLDLAGLLVRKANFLRSSVIMRTSRRIPCDAPVFSCLSSRKRCMVCGGTWIKCSIS